MIGERLIAREAEVLTLLRTIGPDRAYTLIGGYAVDAYSPLPRYSVDLDAVIARAELGQFRSILGRSGFEESEGAWINELEGVETRKFTKPLDSEEVSIDILVDGVRCRQTGAVWKVDEVSGAAKVLRVVGVNDSVPARVASRELLVALKLHSGRDPDLRDVVMLASEADWAAIQEISLRGSKPRLEGQLKHAIEVIGEDEFGSRLKAYFGSKQGQDTRIAAAISKLRDLLSEVKSWSD